MGSKIKTQLKDLDSLDKLESLAKKAHQHITFCGRRYLKFKGYEGTTSLYKIQTVLTKILDKTPFTYPERKLLNKKISAIKSIMKKLYIENFERKPNLITRILLVIRDFFERFSGPAYAAKHLMKEIDLKLYMEEQEIEFLYHSVSCRKEGEISPNPELDTSTILEGDKTT